jgi:DNA polymerase-3 subunit chi
MPQVDFYVLADAAPDAPARYACRLAEKAWRMGHRVYVYTDSPERARALDELLWTFRPDAFVPHGIHPAETAQDLPVLVGSGAPPPGLDDVLVNLHPAVPAFAEGFHRVVELVGVDEPARAAGRERFRSYRERGHAPHTHNL